MVYINVKKAKLDKGLTDNDLKNLTGFSRVHLNAVINGRLDSIRVKKSLCLALNKSFDELWEPIKAQETISC
jgi:DNA-binding Xre family transcriptional regulator